jgi:hypothetical protein
MAGKPTLALLPSYLKAIENSVGTMLFRNLYFRINCEVVDILENGDLSCSAYISSILYLHDLITERHVTVAGTVRDMLASGWYEIPAPKQGAIILWNLNTDDSGTQGKHEHLGFYVDAETAISNSSSERTVVRHHPTYGTLENGKPRREVLAYYWNKKLD